MDKWIQTVFVFTIQKHDKVLKMKWKAGFARNRLSSKSDFFFFFKNDIAYLVFLFCNFY